mgnify:CR=1 FL=1
MRTCTKRRAEYVCYGCVGLEDLGIWYQYARASKGGGNLGGNRDLRRQPAAHKPCPGSLTEGPLTFAFAAAICTRLQALGLPEPE